MTTDEQPRDPWKRWSGALKNGGLGLTGLALTGAAMQLPSGPSAVRTIAFDLLILLTVGTVSVVALASAVQSVREPRPEPLPDILARLCPACGHLGAPSGAPCPHCSLAPDPPTRWSRERVTLVDVACAIVPMGLALLVVVATWHEIQRSWPSWAMVGLVLGLGVLMGGILGGGGYGLTRDLWKRRGLHVIKGEPSWDSRLRRARGQAYLDRRDQLQSAAGTSAWARLLPEPLDLTSIAPERAAALRVVAHLAHSRLLYIAHERLLQWTRQATRLPVAGPEGYRRGSPLDPWTCEEHNLSTVMVVVSERSPERVEALRALRALGLPERIQPLADLLARLTADPGLRTSLTRVAEQADGDRPASRRDLDDQAGRLAAVLAA